MPFQVCKSAGNLPIFRYFRLVTKSFLFTIIEFCIEVVTSLCQHLKTLRIPSFYYTFQWFHRHLIQSNRFLVQKNGKGRERAGRNAPAKAVVVNMSALADGRPWRRKGGSRRHSFVTLLPLLVTFAGRDSALFKLPA